MTHENQKYRDLVCSFACHTADTRHAVVIAEDIRFQNAEWGDEPNMVEIGRAEVRIDLWSIFDGPFLVELIDVDDVEIHLVKPADGHEVVALDLATSLGQVNATGGLSVLAKATWDRLSRSRKPCIDTAEKGRQALGHKFPNIENAD